jgi:hypothetical protein
MPVNLIGHQGGASQETWLTYLRQVEQMSLHEIARVAEHKVKQEKSGEKTDPFLKLLLGLFDRVPYPLLSRAFDLAEKVAERPAMAELLFRQVEVTTVLSNVGASVRLEGGALFRSASMSPSPRLYYVGTVWGAAPIQDEVIAIDGEAKVRPMLPLLLVFDHRLIDGVLASRLFLAISRLLSDPARYLGEEGRAVAFDKESLRARGRS